MKPAEIEAPADMAPVAQSARWIIEVVPALLIPLLEQEGRLPAMPEEIARLSKRPGARPPTPVEGGSLTWALAHRGGTVGGAMGYRDVFDFHTGVDVREIVYVTGKATVALVRWARSTTNRPLQGCLDLGNARMIRAIKALGLTATRVILEDLG